MNIKRFCSLGMVLSLNHGVLFAQKTVQWGATVQAAAKAGLISPEGAPYSVWGRAGASLAAYMEGNDEMSLSFIGRAGLSFDQTQYRIYSGSSFGMEHCAFVLHPEIVIPTRYTPLKITAGFALEWNLYSGQYVQTSEDQTGLGFNLDEISDIIEERERKVIPVITLGILYQIRHHIWLQAFIHQYALNTLPGDPVISFGNNSNTATLKLHHQPTLVGFSLWLGMH